MSPPTTKSPYAGHRFPAEVIGHAVWLYFRFPLSLRMVEEMLAARGIVVSHETVRRWALEFGQAFANRIQRRLPRAGDKWHLAARSGPGVWGRSPCLDDRCTTRPMRRAAAGYPARATGWPAGRTTTGRSSER
jgi:hypothetical protein